MLLHTVRMSLYDISFVFETLFNMCVYVFLCVCMIIFGVLMNLSSIHMSVLRCVFVRMLLYDCIMFLYDVFMIVYGVLMRVNVLYCCMNIFCYVFFICV